MFVSDIPSETIAAPVALAGSAGPDHVSVDVAVVGGGLAGSIAAVQLGQRNVTVAMVDLHGEPHSEFRAEQLVGPQVGRLAELGLLTGMTSQSRLCTEAVNARLGREVDRTSVDQFGVPYDAMVRAARAFMAPTVRFLAGRVASVENGSDKQSVRLSSGTTIQARLVILATGLSTVLPRRLGIAYRTIRESHSLALGFDLDPKGQSPANFPPLIYYGEDTQDRMDYLALFEMHGAIRANLFCYREMQSDWVRAFCRAPKSELLAVMPGLPKVIGPFEITSAVQARANDLRVADDPVRDGVVLVGDAFQTPCPAAGTGIDRLLSDLDILCGTYVPNWLATPGMARDKIATYYADPAKQAFDAECLRIAEYRRAVSTRRGLWWTAHRKQVFFRRQLGALLARRRRVRDAPVRSMAPSL